MQKVYDVDKVNVNDGELKCAGFYEGTALEKYVAARIEYRDARIYADMQRFADAYGITPDEMMDKIDYATGAKDQELRVLRTACQALVNAHFYHRKLKADDYDNIRQLEAYGIALTNPPKDFIISSLAKNGGDSADAEYHDIITRVAQRLNTTGKTIKEFTLALKKKMGE